MANADLIPAVDEVLADKYRIERVLGQGGMGIVFAAMHLNLDERVAIKFLLPELSSDPALVARFLREGRAAIKIRSEHVVKVLDVATMPGGTPYMVMEYLHGRNFEELLEVQGRLPADLAVDHLLQATEALAEAHALGMVHRDLKPANLFLAHRADGSPSVKVLDFGITKVVDPKNAAPFDVTKTSIVMGSPRYMSPEQMRSSRTIDARADIWALGVILQELVTGVAPFDGTTMPDLVAAILQDPPPPLRQLRPDAPEGLEQVITKCLEKDPNARYADVAELTEALAPFGTGSARLSADRVSRVIRPRTQINTSTSAPIVRSALSSVAPASPSFWPEPPTLGTLTVSATESAAPPSAMPPASRGRTVLLACGGIFFATTFVMAMSGGGKGAHPSAADARASSNAVGASGPPPVANESEPAFPAVDLAPTAPPETFDALTVPSSSPPAATTSKRRLRPATSPAPPLKNDIDLFDGRK
jgi:eukaryotic-like serine/threonine-protein kinase